MQINSFSNSIPQTIEELKQWYICQNLPSETITRFFIGKDCPEPSAYGIYKNETIKQIIVYKNNSDGTRYTRYIGTDEAYAVNEIYTKLIKHIAVYANSNNSNEPWKVSDSRHISKESSKSNGIMILLISVAIIGVIILIMWFVIVFPVITRYPNLKKRKEPINILEDYIRDYGEYPDWYYDEFDEEVEWTD